MALVAHLLGRRVYLDTNIFVYAVEGFELFAATVAEILGHIEATRLVAVTSELTLAECLVKPMLEGHTGRQEIYHEMLTSRPALSVVPVSRTVLIEAARIRSTAGAVRLPDAIHLATAVLEGCDTVLTNDRALVSCLENSVAFKRRCIPPGVVAPRSRTAQYASLVAPSPTGASAFSVHTELPKQDTSLVRCTPDSSPRYPFAVRAVATKVRAPLSTPLPGIATTLQGAKIIVAKRGQCICHLTPESQALKIQA